MLKRHQVFVSSTYDDLRLERQEVIQALLELNCIPAGMELFPAANQDQWTLIQQVINDCDYYILIIGGRYGSIGRGGMSYTEMEYRYAIRTGKPVIAFLHRDPTKLAGEKQEQTIVGQKRLQAFRNLAQKKLVKFWKTPAELNALVSRSLANLIATVPAVGWVRANAADHEAHGVTRSAFFPDFHEAFPRLIESSTTVTLFFIHSRRWRENHDESIKKCLNKPRCRMTVFLPDLDNKLLMRSLRQHFEDGPSLRYLISDAYRYFARLALTRPKQLQIRRFVLYPTYSFYRFNQKLIMAMYPTTAKKKNVPTFEVQKGTSYWRFVMDDIETLTKRCHRLGLEELRKLAS